MNQTLTLETNPSERVRGVSQRRAAHVLSNALTVVVDADTRATSRVLQDVDLSGPALRALHELGLGEHVTLRRGGITWRHGDAVGAIVVEVDIRVEPNGEDRTWLSINTRFSATDEPARIRLLDAWALVGPLASTMAQRAARTVKALAERDTFDDRRPAV